MQRGQDDFKRRFVFELRVRIDGDAAAIVADRNGPVFEQFHFNAAGVSGDRFVHGVIENFRDQMVKRRVVGAADIHAGASPNRLQAFKDFDVLGGIGRLLVFYRVLK